jgi:hypothetical protein
MHLPTMAYHDTHQGRWEFAGERLLVRCYAVSAPNFLEPLGTTYMSVWQDIASVWGSNRGQVTCGVWCWLWQRVATSFIAHQGCLATNLPAGLPSEEPHF